MTQSPRGPIQTCAVLNDVARVLPPYLQFITQAKPFEGEASVMTVLGGTKELDRVLARECEGRVVIIDAQCQTHTAFVSNPQIRAAIDGKVEAIIGAIIDQTVGYLRGQIDAGAEAVQGFKTVLADMIDEDSRESVLALVNDQPGT